MITLVGTAVFEIRARRSVVQPHVALVQLSCIEIATALAALTLIFDQDQWREISGDVLDRETSDLKRRIDAAPEYLTPAIIMAASKLAWEARQLRACIEHQAGPDMLRQQTDSAQEALRALDQACSKA